MFASVTSALMLIDSLKAAVPAPVNQAPTTVPAVVVSVPPSHRMDDRPDYSDEESADYESSKSSSARKSKPAKRTSNQMRGAASPRMSRNALGKITETSKSQQLSHQPQSLPKERQQQNGSDDDILIIDEQPAQFGRFRYVAEGRLTFVEGRRPGTYPTVFINPKYRHLVPDGTIVNATLLTRFDDAHGQPVPHWHTLSTKDGCRVPQALRGGQCTFRYLVIQRSRTDGRHSVADQRAVRIQFSVDYFDGLSQRTATAISLPIFNADLKIDRLSQSSCSVEGGCTVFILCSKVIAAHVFTPVYFDKCDCSLDSKEDDRTAHQRQSVLQLHAQVIRLGGGP